MDPARLAALRGRRVLVVGDVIVDRYLKGAVDRISPEAPVPIVRVRGEELRPGGAANVAANLAALGTRPCLVSVVGEDRGASLLRDDLDARGIETHLVPVAGRPTTVKTRIIAHQQQVVRLDDEDDTPVGDDAAHAVRDAALAALEGADGVVVSDYAKGLLDVRVLRPFLAAARRRGLPVVVDPKVPDFGLYQPATVLTPNLGETARAAGRELRPGDAAAAGQAAASLLARVDLEAILVTMGEAGMLLVPRRGEVVRIPAEAREVYDVTGAGDTVAAVLGAALAGGLPMDEAARWANAAAAIAVGHLGTAAVGLEELAAFAARPSGS